MQIKGFYSIHWTRTKVWMMAMSPTVVDLPDGSQTMSWFDTNRDRGADGKIEKELDNGIDFRRDSGELLTVRLMTLSVYRKYFRSTVIGKLNFTSTSKLQEWYMQKFGQRLGTWQKDLVEKKEE